MNVVVVYFGETFRSDEGTSTLSLLRSGAYTLQWFDPRTGVSTVADKRAQTVRGELILPAKPDGQDWVLVVQHVDA
jgi:hypothetical protein